MMSATPTHPAFTLSTPTLRLSSFLHTYAHPVQVQRPPTPAKRARCHPRVLANATPPSESDEGNRNGNEEETLEIPSDWREFRAALIAGSAEELQRAKENAYRPGHWAHALSVPETGCFLASHPAYYRRSAPYLTQAVVFLTQYGPDTGATGLVLNRPLRGTAAELERVGMFGRSTHFAKSPIAEQPIYAGGPDTVDSGVLTVLHGDDALADGPSFRQPLEGVFVGDAADVLGAAVDVATLRFFAGCLRWGKGELEREVDEGSWYCVSASKLFALEHCLQLPKPLWVEIMQCQGHPFAQIASRVYDNDNDGEGSE